MIGRTFERLEEGFIVFLLGAMTLLASLQVVLRYVFNSGISWAMEATSYLFGWLIFFGLAYGVKKGSHIGVDVLVRRLPRAAQQVTGIVAILLCLLYAGLMLYGAYVYVDRMRLLGVEAEDIAIERWILLSILPIGLALLFVRLLQAGWRILAGRAGGLELADEAHEAIEHFKASSEAGADGDKSR